MDSPPVTPPRQTLAGLLLRGFFVALPILIVVVVLQKVHLVLKSALTPILEALPGTVLQHHATQALALVLAVAGLLLLLGYLARTRFGLACGRLLNKGLLRHLPFYESVRRLVDGLQGNFEGDTFKPVVVTIEDGIEQLGVIVERHPDGVCTVYLPSAPNPGSGTVLLVRTGRLREVAVPMHKVFRCQSKWGQGAMAVARETGAPIPPDDNQKSPGES